MTEMSKLLDKLENFYNFQCEGGPLKNCIDWQELRSALRSAEVAEGGMVQPITEAHLQRIRAIVANAKADTRTVEQWAHDLAKDACSDPGEDARLSARSVSSCSDAKERSEGCLRAVTAENRLAAAMAENEKLTVMLRARIQQINELDAALTALRATSSKDGAVEFPYQITFNAIADAVRIEAGFKIGISVESFQKSYNAALAAAGAGEGGKA